MSCEKNSSGYNYKNKRWTKCPTTSGKDNFFHAAFGDIDEPAYFDKHARVRRMRWSAFLTFYENESVPNRLNDILRKVWTTNGRYDRKSYTEYVQDIMTGKKQVSLEEIPLVATIENITIIVLGPDPILIAKPNPDILGDYPKQVPECSKEILLCQETNLYFRLNPVGECNPPKLSKESIRGKAKVFNPALSKYCKGGSAGSKGTEFQVGLIILTLLNIFRSSCEWLLSTENEAAGKFDDVVVECPDGDILIQAKHKENRKKGIVLNQLMCTDTEKNDFGLPKYFISYVKDIKNNFNVKDIIICTNATVENSALTVFIPHRDSHEGILCYSDEEYLFYTLKEELMPQLKESVEKYCYKNGKMNNIMKAVLTNNNLEDFIQKFKFYPNYPSDNKMKIIAEKLLSQIPFVTSLCGQVSYLEIFAKVNDWFQRKNGLYMKDVQVKTMFFEIWKDRYFQTLEQYNISFLDNDLKFPTQKGILHIQIVHNNHMMEELKLFRGLKSKLAQVLYVTSDYSDELFKQVIEVFKLLFHTHLIIIAKDTEEPVSKEICEELEEIVDKHKEKCVILVAEHSNKLMKLIKSNSKYYHTLNFSVTFQDLSKHSQESLLQKKCISFQGSDYNLHQFFPLGKEDDQVKHLNSDILTKLLCGNAKIGLEVPDLDEDIARYYISLKFKREDQILSEEHIYELNEKIVLISDMPGTGKTTVLKKLALNIKQKYPLLWVIRIELNEYTTCFDQLLKENKKSIKITEFLGLKNKFNQLERMMFSTNKRVVLMLDSVDEISPDYTKFVLNLLVQCLNSSSFEKIFVTTRRNIAAELEANLKIRPFMIQPFTLENQVEFLTKYWTYNLRVTDESSKKCKVYARALITKLLTWMNVSEETEDQFASIPLHVKMLAEVFQESNRGDEPRKWEGCKEYLSSEKTEPMLPKAMDIAVLYQLFIAKKRSVFMDKGNPSRTVAASEALGRQYDMYLVSHRQLALEVIFSEKECKLFTTYQKIEEHLDANMFKIGIVQVLDSSVHFVHRTFAEYFVAESLKKEFENVNGHAKFQKFFVGDILYDYRFSVVRAFFENILKDNSNLTRMDMFKKYQTSVFESVYDMRTNLIHRLAEEGFASILECIFKCIEFRVVTGKEIKIAELKMASNVPRNTLNALKYLVRQAGVNIRDMRSNTPLHYAAEQGHFNMVKFLIQKGADVNSLDGIYQSPLHFAIQNNYFNMVKLLVEERADFNAKHEFGCSPLFFAIQEGHAKVVNYFLEKCLETGVTSTQRIPIALAAAYLGRLDVLKDVVAEGLHVNEQIEGEYLITAAISGRQSNTIQYLMQKGADINKKDKKGNSALHTIFDKTSNRNLDRSSAELLLKLGADINTGNRFDQTVLHIAAGQGSLDDIKFLLNNGAEINITDKYGYTPVYIAVNFGHRETVRYLVDHGADVNIKNSKGNVPLHLAVCRGDLDAVQFLILECDAQVDIKDNEGNTLFHYVVSKDLLLTDIFYVPECDMNYTRDITRDKPSVLTKGICNHIGCVDTHLDIVKFLISKCNGNVNIQNNEGSTALHLAVNKNQIDTLKSLIAYDGDITIKNSNGHTLIHIGALLNCTNIVHFLVREHDADINYQDNEGSTPIHLAVENGHLNIVEYFLVECKGNKCITNNDGQTLLHVAVREHHLDIAEFLTLSQGMNVNAEDNKGNTPLHLAVINNYEDIVEFLIKRGGADISIRDSSGRTPLQSAKFWNHLSILRFFVVECNIDLKDENGYTPLHLEAALGNISSMEFLFVTHGIKINIADSNGCTPLHIAIHHGQLHAIERLALLWNANVHIKDYKGYTALHHAVGLANIDVIRLLILSCGANVNAQDNDGCTPLQLAVKQNNLHCIQYLVKRCHADVNILNKNGCTALHLSVTSGFLKAAKFLVNCGANINVKDNSGQTPCSLSISGRHLGITKFFMEECKEECLGILLHATKKGNIETVQFLIGECSMDVESEDDSGCTLLHLAVRENHLALIKLLALEYHADVDTKDNDGRSPVHFATKTGESETVRCLVLECHADVNICDSKGYRSLHLAVSLGLNIVKLLIQECRANVDAKENEGFTPLNFAITNGELNIVKFLMVECDANSNIPDNRGYTSLHFAAEIGRSDIITFLISKCNLNVNATDNGNRTPLHLASRMGYLKAVKVLVNNGASTKLKDNRGYTPIRVAIKKHKLSVARWLLLNKTK